MNGYHKIAGATLIDASMGELIEHQPCLPSTSRGSIPVKLSVHHWCRMESNMVCIAFEAGD